MFSKKINCNRIRKIPKKIYVPWIVFSLLSLILIMNSFFPTYRELDNLQDVRINIEESYLSDSLSRNGRLVKLSIVSAGVTYYIWYPEYRDYMNAVENDILTGNIKSVDAKIVKTQSFRDRLLNQRKIVDLRSDDAIYYDLDTEMNSQRLNHIASIVIAAFFLAVWMFYTLCTMLVYRVLN